MHEKQVNAGTVPVLCPRCSQIDSLEWPMPLNRSASVQSSRRAERDPAQLSSQARAGASQWAAPGLSPHRSTFNRSAVAGRSVLRSNVEPSAQPHQVMPRFDVSSTDAAPHKADVSGYSNPAFAQKARQDPPNCRLQ